MEIAPELVRRESRVEDFLRREEGNPLPAARRLARYWKVRKAAFAERWLLPLTQTGTGALNMTDISLLRTGFFTVLRRPSGGLVVLYDESRLDRSPGVVILRCAFYYTFVFEQDIHDVTFVHVVTSKPRPPVVLDPERWQIFLSVLPLRITKMLVGQAPEFGKEELIDFLGYKLMRATEFKSKLPSTRINGKSVKETVKLFQAQGIEPECMPQCLGGMYDYSTDFHDFIRTRLSVEYAMASIPLRCYRAASVAQVTNTTCVVTRGALSRGLDDRVRRQLNLDASQPVPEQALARQRSALYSRRSYQKQKLAILTLQEQCRVWRSKNQALRSQNEWLEEQLKKACNLVATSNADIPRNTTLDAPPSLNSANAAMIRRQIS